jgi:hypothetical protein
MRTFHVQAGAYVYGHELKTSSFVISLASTGVSRDRPAERPFQLGILHPIRSFAPTRSARNQPPVVLTIEVA